MPDPRVKIGILVWPQYTDWASLREAGATVDRLGFDSLWTWDHLRCAAGASKSDEIATISNGPCCLAPQWFADRRPMHAQLCLRSAG